MLPKKMVDLDRVIASSPVVVLWGEPLDHRPVDFVTDNVSQFGYAVPEMVLEEVRYDSIVFDEDRERVRSAFQNALLDGSDSFILDYRIITRSGAVRWVEDRVAFHREVVDQRLEPFAGKVGGVNRRRLGAQARIGEFEDGKQGHGGSGAGVRPQWVAIPILARPTLPPACQGTGFVGYSGTAQGEICQRQRGDGRHASTRF